MKILAVGDIVGNNGVNTLKRYLPAIKEEYNIDFTIVNGENAAEGMGITQNNFNNILKAGADIVTMGNHTWSRRDIFKILNNPQIIRPANCTEGMIGRGYRIVEKNGKKIAVINLIGRVDMQILSNNPFTKAKELAGKLQKQADIIIIDFHAEATAEKIAMGYFVDGKVTAVFGTHTHVQTADEQILPKGTAYITDIGMTGPKKSVIGMDIYTFLRRFETTIPERYRTAQGEGMLNGIIIDIDDETNKAKQILRIKK